jgi:predicted DCC family thiol-disulfide oxidoreductase YuxK
MAVMQSPAALATTSASTSASSRTHEPSPLRLLLHHLRKAYSLDLRSLALFRIALASVVLGDLFFRSFDLTAFYTDWGVLPRAALLEKFSPVQRFSIHLISGELAFQIALFLLSAIFALMLLFGIRTRLAAIVTWFMLVSLQNRTPVILQGGDVYLRLLAFIAIFLPIGALYSVDCALDTVSRERKRVRGFAYLSVPVITLIVQIAMVYAFAVTLKTGPEWRSDHTAVYYALSIQQMATPVGRFLLHLPKLLPWLTRWTMFHEGVLPLLILTPIFAGPARLLAVLLIFGLHIGLGVSIRLGHFPYIACMAAVALIPSWFWEHERIRRALPWSTGEANWGSGVRIYYDANCSFCSKAVRILRTFLLLNAAEIVPAQEMSLTELEMRHHRSWIVVEPDGRRSYKWNALCELVSYSPLFRWIVPAMRVDWVSNIGGLIYEDVERARTHLSRWTEWIKPHPVNMRTPVIVNVFALLLIVYIYIWNLSSITRIALQPWQDSIGLTLAVDQKWNMFAPNPLTYDGWYVVNGRLQDGEQVNVIHPNQRVSFVPPASIADEYPNERWRKYLMNLSLPDNTQYRLYYGRYLCRTWNDGRALQDAHALISFDIYFMAHQNSIDHPPVGFSRDLLWHHECFK